MARGEGWVLVRRDEDTSKLVLFSSGGPMNSGRFTFEMIADISRPRVESGRRMSFGRYARCEERFESIDIGSRC